jgi:hypothetical protein
MLVARGERSACDPATDVAYCAKEERLLGFSAGEGDLTRPSARPAGLVAVFGGRCRGLVPTGQLELRDRLRHNGHEELYLTILSYALHVLLYHFCAGMASIPRCESPAVFSIFARLYVSSYLQIVGSKIIENRIFRASRCCANTAQDFK